MSAKQSEYFNKDFEVLNPEARKLIKDRLSNIKETNEINFNTVSDELKNLLAESKMPA